jgi:hypothetical protein
LNDARRGSPACACVPYLLATTLVPQLGRELSVCIAGARWRSDRLDGEQSVCGPTARGIIHA